jgi:L,D-peptidoglycan transpeptidase YkuD (ErfK/YbiS/YcfS/YnhG family)
LIAWRASRAAALVAVAVAAGALAAPAAARRFKVPARADQLIVVSSSTYDPPGYLASFRAYRRANARSPWRKVFGPWQAETGYGHLKDSRREGDGSTPTGVYGIESTLYGDDPNPGGLRDAYHRLVCGDWWDEDQYSPRYNQFVHVPCGTTPSFAPGSEALWTETLAYPYFAVIRFNVDPTIGGAGGRGSGIFLHSWIGAPTDGCVALPEPELLEVLRWLRPAKHPVIEIGTDREVGPVPPRTS